MTDILAALQIRNYYAAFAIALTIAVQLVRKSPVLRDLWEKIPDGSRFLVPLVGGAVTGFVDAYRAGQPLADALLAALGGALGVGVMSMGYAAMLRESPAPWDGGAGGEWRPSTRRHSTILPPLMLVLAALLLAACAKGPPLLPGPLGHGEQATVAIERSEPHWPDQMVNELQAPAPTWAFTVACGGVAIGRRTIATAAHCVPRDTDVIGYVTRADWFAHSDLVDVGRVASVRGETAFVATSSDLPRYVPSRRPLLGEPVAIVHAIGDYKRLGCRVRLVQGDAFSVYVHLEEGMSGSPAFGSDGAVLGLAQSCRARDGVCVGPGEFTGLP